MKPFAELTNFNQDDSNLSKESESDFQTDKKPSFLFSEQILSALSSTDRKICYTTTKETLQMRENLFKWLIAKSTITLELKASTIQHAMKLFDLYLTQSASSIVASLQANKKTLIACLLISSKYVEIYPPTTSDFVYIAKNIYSEANLVLSQMQVLHKVKYLLNYPLISDWVYALSGKAMLDLVINSVPLLPPSISYRKIADQAVAMKLFDDLQLRQQQAIKMIHKLVKRIVFKK